jgi:hypothetical protein
MTGGDQSLMHVHGRAGNGAAASALPTIPSDLLIRYLMKMDQQRGRVFVA